ncbi:MAG TPA: LysR family transcriptional regulator [Streptosporangiaceae bacterium]|nr:LysR family transcriptional regulator [Streptosporangiaceae bacterium]
MLDATRLRVLVAIAKYGSVTGAAHALNYAQPSISHHIARLEAETGAKLMERAGRGVKLTDAGQLLAERAEEILGRLDAAEAELALHIGLRQDRVRLAAFGSALSTLVAAAATALHAEHADSGIQIIQAEPGQALRMLRAGETDIALIFRYLRDGAELDSIPVETKGQRADDDSNIQIVLDEPVYLVSQAGPPIRARTSALQRPGLAAPAPIHADPELRQALLTARADQHWIGADEQCAEFTLDLCRGAGFAPEMTTRAADYVAAQALVAAGLGVAILPGLALRAVARQGIEATELPGARRQILAVTYPASPDAAAVTRLVNALASAAISSSLCAE